MLFAALHASAVGTIDCTNRGVGDLLAELLLRDAREESERRL
jgi:hypothetical protein